MEILKALVIIFGAVTLFGIPIAILGRRIALRDFQIAAMAMQNYASTAYTARKKEVIGNKLVKDLCTSFLRLRYYAVTTETVNRLMEKWFSEASQKETVDMFFADDEEGPILTMWKSSLRVKYLISGKFTMFN